MAIQPANREPRPQGPTFTKLGQDIKKHRLIMYKVLAITFVLSAIYALSLPNYYTCKVMLAPEISSSKSSSSLAGLASTFGISLGGAGNGADALTPTLYPELMNSVAFRASLFPVGVTYDGEKISYFDYLSHHQKAPWWSMAFNGIKSMFNGQLSMVNEKVNPFQLTDDQSAVAEVMAEKVVCDVDAMTLAITINVTDQDPLVAATMADSVKTHLQEFITNYRTQKARVDLEHTRKLYKETKAKYDSARQRYASFADANQHVFLERVRSQQSNLENELQIQTRAYSNVAAQLQLAEAKVQEETPAFTTLQPASVPLKKKGPKRSRICLMALFIAFLGTSIYAIKKEGHLSSL